MGSFPASLIVVLALLPVAVSLIFQHSCKLYPALSAVNSAPVSHELPLTEDTGGGWRREEDKRKRGGDREGNSAKKVTSKDGGSSFDNKVLDRPSLEVR